MRTPGTSLGVSIDEAVYNRLYTRAVNSQLYLTSYENISQMPTNNKTLFTLKVSRQSYEEMGFFSWLYMYRHKETYSGCLPDTLDIVAVRRLVAISDHTEISL